MAVLTSCIPELCRAALAHHGILDWFQGVVYAQETGIGKGEPELYRLAAERWGRAPEECILFEDSPGYCAAAREAGFFVAGVRDPLYAGREEEIQGLCRGWVEGLPAGFGAHLGANSDAGGGPGRGGSERMRHNRKM